ncbi:alpha/beta hydrolase [Novosphingobium sp. APW14]|uniref:alpha/beta hydrolase n=1 Tax=Novosphingobium sp. APW14 TaxID=3077237 RepID=UPI0028E059F2|nr:alpha/beta hydrolase [Novosphingobium sp. APW14]MDT9013185.1 alpha/beta hydrolase [Novosphingobium sp. APW14]
MSAAFARRVVPAGAIESNWIAADRHPLRRIDWVPPHAKGSILFLTGRGDFYEKYIEAMARWHDRNWAVSAFDWRGQGGSGRLGSDPYTGHVEDFGIWVEDLRQFWHEWVSTKPGPHFVIGHSMGGHLALRATAQGAIKPKALVLSAPMLGLRDGNMPDWLMHAAARVMCRLGDPRRPAWKWSDKPGQPPDSRGDLLTHDADRYADELWWREQRPELVMGPGSWRWIERAYASMQWLARDAVLASIQIPVLLLATDQDALVSFKAIARAAQRLPHCELINFADRARHEILREADPVRTEALDRIDAFLARAST